MTASKTDSSWLDIGTGENDAYIIRDHGQLGRIIKQLPDPRHQCPRLSVFLGGRMKDMTLQSLYPQNNIRRTRPTTGIGLRIDHSSAELREPHLFVDGGVEPFASRPCQARTGVQEHPISWRAASVPAALQVIYARLVFLFADVICIFVDDFPSIQSVAAFLANCDHVGSASSLPVAVRPRIIIVSSGSEGFSPKIHTGNTDRVLKSFAAVQLVNVDPASRCTLRDRLRASIQSHLADAQDARRTHGAVLNGLHLHGLFDLAAKHLSTDQSSPFDFVKATREATPVPAGLDDRIAHFFDVGCRAGCRVDTLVSSTASALLMDHYVPDTVCKSDRVARMVAIPSPFSPFWLTRHSHRGLVLDPRIVFRTLYRPSVLRGVRSLEGLKFGTPVASIASQVEAEFVSHFGSVVALGKSTADHRRDQMLATSHELGRVHSDKLCLFCLVRSAQHAQACHHALCDVCAQVFGRPAVRAEYQFTISTCLVCLSEASLVIDVLPPTLNPTILAIDGGGVRGGIPLEYLLLIQEHLGPDCGIQELIDLSVGSSSGGLIVLGLACMEWDVATCSQVFDRLARRIFRERRRLTLSRFCRVLLGRDSLLSGVLQWISWLLHDGCYDPTVFDASLREAFGNAHRIFDVVGSRPGSHARSKFGVIATTIAKETKSFVFGNFNAADPSAGDHEHELFRAEKNNEEPLIWEVARATAAAPFFFSPANIRAVGSFQDGGLRDNFAAGIARRISRRIWPSKTGTGRLLSLGTGKTEHLSDRSPHFRHVWRDGFLRRGYDALMSNLDTEPKWLELKSQLEEGVQNDYLRFNVSLDGIPCTIDDVNAMDDYRNLVLLQAGAARRAREAATALLVARFYFELDWEGVPPSVSSTGWYRGTIRCKGPTKQILEALRRLHPDDVDFVTDTGFVGQFGALEDTCLACGRYVKSISVFVQHPKEPLNIYMRTSRHHQWRISGFPASLSSFMEVAKLQQVFGHASHGRPAALPCGGCDTWETRRQCHRQKRVSTEPGDSASKRLCVVGDIRD